MTMVDLYPEMVDCKKLQESLSILIKYKTIVTPKIVNILKVFIQHFS
jgi:hypothetical protein